MLNKNKRYTPTFIDGKPYAVCLPTGGQNEGDPCYWDSMLMTLGDKAEKLLHINGIGSWCQEFSAEDPMRCVLRGSEDCSDWKIYYYDACDYEMGFRPCLLPLDPETLLPCPAAFSEHRIGDVITFGTLYVSSKPIANPIGEQDTPDFHAHLGDTIKLGNSDSNPDNLIKWINLGSSLIADRVLGKSVQWDELDVQDLVFSNREDRASAHALNFLDKMQNDIDGDVICSLTYILSGLTDNFEYQNCQLADLNRSEAARLAHRILKCHNYAHNGASLDDKIKAVYNLLDKGLSENLFSDLPKLSPTETKKLLLTCDLDTFRLLIDTVCEIARFCSLFNYETAAEYKSATAAIQKDADPEALASARFSFKSI